MARPGDRIRHPIGGDGVLVAEVDGGRRWIVIFDATPSLQRIVPAHATRLLPPQEPAPPPRPARQDEATAAPGLLPPVTEPPPDARQALEALRLGVVPASGLETLTVERDTEIATLGDLLRRERGMVLLAGAYGTGKTHLVELAENHALRAGYLVARVSFDPEEVPPSHPLRLYRALAGQIRYPDGAGVGLRPLLERVADRPSHLEPAGKAFHRYLGPAAWAVAHADDVLAEDLLAWIEGALPRSHRDLTGDLKRFGWRGPNLLALPDYRTFGQVMAHLLGGVAAWAQDAGWRGLAVLLDEAEYLDHLGSTSREMATNVLKYLAFASLDPSVLPYREADVYRGGHAVHRSLSTVYRTGQPLVVVCAFTPHPGIFDLLRRISGDSVPILEIGTIEPGALGTLADRILALYARARPDLDPPEGHRLALRSALTGAFRRGELETVRRAARTVVEFWDIYQVSPERALAALGA
ncbi:MAG: DUF2791 family P-loop domain-containing protein [Deltaproteobacteria bacterium]|nr:DUF2791 family P-loop domain-containing protein [Deltaproteobacteria bacterium]